jgi:OTU-like cysteine protease
LMRAVVAIKRWFAQFVAVTLYCAYKTIVGCDLKDSELDLAKILKLIKKSNKRPKRKKKTKQKKNEEKNKNSDGESLAALRNLVKALPKLMFEDLSLKRFRSSPGGDNVIDQDEDLNQPDRDQLLSGDTMRLLELYGLKIKDTVTDGNCMYDALCQQLEFVEELTIEIEDLRRKASALIKANRNQIKPYLTGKQSVKKLAKQVARNLSWNNDGGDIAAEIVATVLQRDIIVISPGRIDVRAPIGRLNTPARATVQSNGKALTIVYNGVDHYYSTVPIDKAKPDDRG